MSVKFCSKPPLSVTVYVTGQSDVDAVHDTVAVVCEAAPATFVGAVGTVHVVVKVPVPALLEPAALLATTSMLYSVPGLRPVYDALFPLTICSSPPFSVTVYVSSQSDVEASHVIEADVPVTLLAATPAGVVGSVHVVVNDPVPALLDPAAFVATTWML